MLLPLDQFSKRPVKYVNGGGGPLTSQEEKRSQVYVWSGCRILRGSSGKAYTPV